MSHEDGIDDRKWTIQRMLSRPDQLFVWALFFFLVINLSHVQSIKSIWCDAAHWNFVSIFVPINRNLVLFNL